MRLFFLLFALVLPSWVGAQTKPPIYIAFLWHMHQPIYWPYESVVQTESRGAYSFSLRQVHTSRSGPYTTWPRNAVNMGRTMPHFGAQVSFSGSLIENLNAAEQAGWGFGNWRSHWNEARSWRTSLDNPRLDMVAFGYHHPLMPLITLRDIRRQIAWHREITLQQFTGAPYSRGIFPPETAFSKRIIPALVQEGIEWAIVDNLHFERASEGAPVGDQSGVTRPNRADVRNPNPNDWVQLNGVWAPTPISAQWAHQPRFVSWTDPESGEKYRMIAVPASRYLGEEDGRGGYGALNYETVLSQLEPYNTDPDHPILVVLHHDGDNYGGGSEGYYTSNFQNMVNWLAANPGRFQVTTIQDYLDRFPPNPAEEIHIQDGAWLGASAGDPQFRKWLGTPGAYAGATGAYSPDANSWGVITAAQNVVYTADQINPTAPATQQAWRFFLNGQASDYWYWDGTEMWDSHPARAANQAVAAALPIAQGGEDRTPPAIFLPQRTPYNPGAIEFGQTPQPSDFTVWTYAFDLSGLTNVTLKYRIATGDRVTDDNLTYAGGAGVGAWQAVPMTSRVEPSITNPVPTYKADVYSAALTGFQNVLLDYYVEATDARGNTARTIIQHVWVGDATTGGGGGGGGSSRVTWTPTSPTGDDVISITIGGASGGAKLHWGVNGAGSSWQTPNEAYWPQGTARFGSGSAVETPFTQDGDTLRLQIGPFNHAAQRVTTVNFVIHWDNDTWDNNGGRDYAIAITQEGGGTDPEPGAPFVMDGSLDDRAILVGEQAGRKLFAAWNGADLYLATETAGVQGDLFLLVAGTPGAMGPAMWAKAGQIAAPAAYLARESTNGWNGWFNAPGAQQASGTVLEGTVRLASVLGSLPESVRIALLEYQTQDAGAMLGSVPAVSGTNFTAADYAVFELRTATSSERGFGVREFGLLPAWPNPTTGLTTVGVRVPAVGELDVHLYDSLGRLVATLASGTFGAGELPFAIDTAGWAPGVYHIRAQWNDTVATRSLIVR